MSKLADELQPYSLEAVCAADRAAGMNHIVVDVAKQYNGRIIPSSGHLLRKVEKLLFSSPNAVATTKKLYIIGAWIPTESEGKHSEVVVTALEMVCLYANVHAEREDHY